MKFANISGGFGRDLNFELIEKFPWGTPLVRSEEHTSELQSLTNLVCRLLLEKKKKIIIITIIIIIIINFK